VPCLAWLIPVSMASLLEPDRLESAWLLGAAALLATGVSLGVLARARRSRPLAVITVVYLVVAVLAAIWDIEEGIAVPIMFVPYANPGVALPALILLAAGLAAALAAGMRGLQARA
jgi:hypothetical protein